MALDDFVYDELVEWFNEICKAEAAERAVAAWKNNANTVGLKVVNA